MTDNELAELDEEWYPPEGYTWDEYMVCGVDRFMELLEKWESGKLKRPTSRFVKSSHHSTGRSREKPHRYWTSS